MILFGSLILSSCSAGGTEEPPGTSAADTQNQTDTESSDTAEPSASPETPAGPPESLKILAIGNSFSTDAMAHLYGIARNAGVQEIVLGNLFYSSCSTAMHAQFAQKNEAVYTYHKNSSGIWETTEGYTMEAALADEDWDYISLQETSKTSGVRVGYAALPDLIQYVRERSGDAQLVWHMTWAYQQDSTHASFVNYGRSQQKMYEKILDCLENVILTPENGFDLCVPNMTSIQNARTSFLGDTLTRDGFHLDYNIGRYIAGLTFYAALTGDSVEKISYNPDPASVSDDMLAVAREAAANAVANPMEVTPSAITSGKRADPSPVIPETEVLHAEDFYEADCRVAASHGVDLAGYTLFTWEYLENSYWVCTGSAAEPTVPTASVSTYRQNVCTDRLFSLSEIPIGSVFITDKGWQFRPEIYVTDTEKYTGTRPSICRESFFQLTEAFMGDCGYIAWNVSSSPKTDISRIYAQAACHVRVYVPAP